MIIELPYSSETANLFARLADRPWAVFLDSAHRHPARGRYDIVAAFPRKTLWTERDITWVAGQRGLRAECLDPFEVLRREMGSPMEADTDVPFCGGAIGYFGYDLGRRGLALPTRKQTDPMPEMAVAIYDAAVVVDHGKRATYFVSRSGLSPDWDELLNRSLDNAKPESGEPFLVTGELRSNMKRAQYEAAVERVKRYIRDGDCYQVNLAQRFECFVQGDPWEAYRTLRKLSPAPFAAYVNTPWGEILSTSPERFLRLVGREIETRPIKGTRRRSRDPEEDNALRSELAVSGKDRAENLMIVDLLRNDLGKHCVAGSIDVPELFAVESFANVHHLVSSVTGRLEAGFDALHLLQGAFPGGSITGAPKRRAVEIIDEIEPDARGVYCGAIGYIGFDGAMDTNIAIRTLVHQNGRVRFWAGGGIVHDSCPEAEYQETLDKASAMLRLLRVEG